MPERSCLCLPWHHCFFLCMRQRSPGCSTCAVLHMNSDRVSYGYDYVSGPKANSRDKMFYCERNLSWMIHKLQPGQTLHTACSGVSIISKHKTGCFYGADYSLMESLSVVSIGLCSSPDTTSASRSYLIVLPGLCLAWKSDMCWMAWRCHYLVWAFHMKALRERK